MTKRRGFTLLELLVTASLLAVMALACYSALARGLDVWGRANGRGGRDREIKFVLERMAKEVRNSYLFAGIPFRGGEDRLTFSGYLPRTDGEGPQGSDGIGELSYFFDASRGTLMRRQKSYNELSQRFFEPPAQEVLGGLEGFRVEYYGLDPKDQAVKWTEAWDKGGEVPQGVRVTVLVKDGSKDPKPVVKTTYLLLALGKGRAGT